MESRFFVSVYEVINCFILNCSRMENEDLFNEEFKGFIQELVENWYLEGKEAGIAKLMLDKGYEALSDKQKFVLNKAIKENYIKECSRCGSNIPLSEMLDALDNGGLCNYCQHLKEKIEKE
jgi:hypothetical protein